VGRSLFAALLLSCPLAAAPAAPPVQDGGGMEEFEEVDPYTENDPERMALLGYVSYGPFPWLKGETTAQVQEKMGAIPMLWVETAHFRIGSSLGTYELPGDREEKARLKDEIDRLRGKLGKLKAPKREVDPWLRLHLYAQRMEELYAAFLADFRLAESDFSSLGPYVGQPAKLLLLVCERKSEYSRHASTYLDAQSDSSFRFGWSGIGMGFATNVESLREGWQGAGAIPFDSVLFCTIANAFGQVLIDAYRQNDYGAPEWLRRGYSHVAQRRFDPRWIHDAGYQQGQGIREDDWEWEPRVSNLVKNDFFTSLADMLAWTRETQANQRDHMVAWSKVEYFLTQVEGNHAAFLTAVCKKTPKGAPEVVQNELLTRQTHAFKTCFELTPETFDEGWADWVDDEYEKD
jgi:hypothetical protein